MRRWVLALVISILGCALVTEAAPINELELGGTAANNSAATAQTIPTNAFTLPVPATVFDPPGFPTATILGHNGGGDVDLYRVSGHGHIILDIDDEGLSSPDTIVSLFSGSALLAVNDDGGTDPGSETIHDSLVFFDLPNPGVYFIAVTLFENFPCDQPGPCSIDTAFDPNNPQPEENVALYQLHVSLEHPHRVPAPATLILAGICGVAGIMSALRRRR